MKKSIPEKYINKIKNNLDKFNISINDFQNKFKYCGGDKGWY